MHREDLHLAELGIATLTSCFINANRDPKSEAAKPSDFFYFTLLTDEGDRISPAAANAFFALADAGKLPGWVVAIAPIDKLAKSRNGIAVNPVVWVGEGLVLIQPVVDGTLVRFSLGFQDFMENFSGSSITLRDVDSGEQNAIALNDTGSAWILDGEMVLI